MSISVKALEPAFQGAGQRAGIEIWRIENFKPVPLPKSDYGKFYSGDSYIVLQTISGKGGTYMFDIHFWLGKDTSQDEAGTAAIKTVELDTILGGKAVQHREIQGHESDKFLSYFKPCIIPLEGGVASGFKTPEEEAFETRLYVCKGKRVVRMKQVPFSRPSLNHDDVFILDTEDKIYQFNGANSNIQERAKALEVIQFLKDTYHGGVCKVAIVEDGNLQAEADSGEFWELFGGFAPMGRKVSSEDDIIPEKTPPKLFCIADGQVNPVDGELSKSILENTKCYLLDCGAEVFVWVGRVTQLDERKTATQTAEEFLSNQSRPKATKITRLIQGYETNTFKCEFDSWPSASASAPEEGRGKVAALLKQQGGGIKSATKSTPVKEEVPPLLDGDGKIEVWYINDNAKTPVPKEDYGKFHSGDCYIVQYSYHSHDKKDDYYLCWWIGKDSVEEDQIMAAELVTKMFNTLKGRPVMGRIYQGKEPPQFVAIFQPMVVLKGGLSSGYKNYIADKGLNDETYTTDSVALIQISGTSVHNNKAVQVDAVATSLNSNECFLLQSASMFIWHGIQSTYEQQQLAAKIAEFLKPGVSVKHTKEGAEISAFWSTLGGKENFTSKKAPQEVVVRDPHLFTYSINKGGKFEVKEVYNFSQDDLLTEDVLLLDTHAEVFVWLGQLTDSNEKQTAFEIGQKYINMAASLDGLSPNVPLYKVTEGNEPCFFTAFFSWDPAKAIAHGNSFQKKVFLLLGIGHSSEGKSNMNQDGPTQRASALAALNSAFSSSSSSSKPSSPRPAAGTTQGSQRAAAIAALSSVLTAEQKQALAGAENENADGEDSEAKEAEAGDESAVETNEENSEAVPEEEQGGNGNESLAIYSYEQVKAKSENPASGIDLKKREAYLSDEEFEAILEMPKEAFYKLPKWKQDQLKKKVDLF